MISWLTVRFRKWQIIHQSPWLSTYPSNNSHAGGLCQIQTICPSWLCFFQRRILASKTITVSFFCCPDSPAFCSVFMSIYFLFFYHECSVCPLFVFCLLGFFFNWGEMCLRRSNMLVAILWSRAWLTFKRTFPWRQQGAVVIGDKKMA